LEGEPKKKEEDKYVGTAVIVVNHASLVKFLKMNKVIVGGDSVVIKENVRKGRPNFLKRHRQAQQEP
jgi:hypothetical protein